MNILLVAMNAKFIHSSLSVRSIAAFGNQQKSPCVFSVREHTINENIREVFRDLYEKKADVYGFSCYIWNIEVIKELAMLLKKARPSVPIVLGGPEAFGNGQSLMKEAPYIDYIIKGEGEYSFFALSEAIRNNTDKGKVPGVMYRDDEETICENAPCELLPMDDIPFVYAECDMEALQNKLVYYETSRGCPFGCTYCMSSVEKKVRFRNLDTVKNELLFFLRHKIPIVKFVDRTFNCDRERTKEIIRFLIENKGDTLFHCEISADLLTDDIFEILSFAPPGLFQFEIGIQSTCPEVLRAVHRKEDTTRCLQSIQKLMEIGTIAVHVDLIAGLPKDTKETFCRSFNETYALCADVIQLGFLKVLYGSPMEQDAVKYGLVYSDIPPYEIIHTPDMSVEDLLEIKRVEQAVDCFYNSKRFVNSLPIAVLKAASPYDFFLRVSWELCEANSHAKLCRLLWEASDRSNELKFSLILDFLLENRGKEIPEYFEQVPLRDWKKRSQKYLIDSGVQNIREARKYLHFTQIEGRIIEIDYQTKKWRDVTAEFPN